MLRSPAVAGRFYPAQPAALERTVRSLLQAECPPLAPAPFRACLVPHAGYDYSGHVAASVYSRIAIPSAVIILGVRHFPRGESAAIPSAVPWSTPLGTAQIQAALAGELLAFCPPLREDDVAHATEHSIEVQLPFLQVLRPDFSFVPIVLGTLRFEELESIGIGLAQILRKHEEVLLLTTSDLNHYEDEATTREKDRKAIDQLLMLDASGLYETCLREQISMCGLSPAVVLLTALRQLGGIKAELVRHATSGDVSKDRDAVVGYAGMLFEQESASLRTND